MIKVNLSPQEELESQLWFVPDLAFLILVIAVSYLAAVLLLDLKRKEIEVVQKETTETLAAATALEKDVAELERTTNELKDTNEKITEIKPVSGSQLKRYLPLIVVEHLQNLRPEGLWFERLTFAPRDLAVALSGEEPGPLPQSEPVANNEAPEGSPRETPPDPATLVARFDANEVQIVGYAYENLLIADFLTSLRATQVQEIDPSDVRSMVYFSEVNLINSTEGVLGEVLNQGSLPPDRAKRTIYQFTIELRYQNADSPRGVDSLSRRSEFPVNTASFNLENKLGI